MKTFRSLPILLAAATLLVLPATAHAYVGPGAGFAFVSSFLVLFMTMAMAFVTLLTWPIRWVWRAFRGRKAWKKARVKRVVILGLDGQDPELTERFMDEGILPNFSKLRDEGCFTRLQTSLLSESPVAWSSFQTGSNPGKHRIYDFLVPNRRLMVPELSSAQVAPSQRTLNLGKWRIPLGKPRIEVGRKSRPFWKTLGDHGVFSAVLRVPITFPPEKFRGVLLSAMCLPDLRGSQGTYFYYSAAPGDERKLTSGQQLPLKQEGDTATGELLGPENSLKADGGEMTIPFTARAIADDEVEITIQKQKYRVRKGEYTPWIQADFKPGLRIKVRGLVMFHLIEAKPHVRLYVPPIQIDPAKPALPISYPFAYATYLAKLQGPYATLGVAEDTSALNEDVIDEDAFLKQAWQIHDERETMFFDSMDKVRRGLTCCVFDITDRLQHMFFRCMDDDHPANANREVERYRNILRDMYVKMDDLLGRTRAKLGKNDVLMVMSDHGFKSFRRGVNLNTWMWKNGFLALKNDTRVDDDMLQAIDWSRTQAYAVGFGGIYLNLKDRESKGIVERSEAEGIKARIRDGLLALEDPREGVKPIKRVYNRDDVFNGPYVGEAPDLVAGFRVGWRVGWSSVTGGVSEEIFEDNTRPWSGDHNMNPPDVPGMFFSNRPISVESPHIMDLGPTTLDLFGVPVPSWCDGQSVMPAGAPAAPPPASAEKEQIEEAEKVARVES